MSAKKFKNKTLERDVNSEGFNIENCTVGSVGGFSIEYTEDEINSYTSYLYKSKEDLYHDLSLLK